MPSPPAGCRCRSPDRSDRFRSTTRTRTPVDRRPPAVRSPRHPSTSASTVPTTCTRSTPRSTSTSTSGPSSRSGTGRATPPSRMRRHERRTTRSPIDALERGGTVTVEVDVTNTSDRRGDEVIQAYLEDVVASVAPPVRRLVAFERRTIEPGEHRHRLVRARHRRARLLVDGCRGRALRRRARALPPPRRQHARAHAGRRVARALRAWPNRDGRGGRRRRRPRRRRPTADGRRASRPRGGPAIPRRPHRTTRARPPSAATVSRPTWPTARRGIPSR